MNSLPPVSEVTPDLPSAKSSTKSSSKSSTNNTKGSTSDAGAFAKALDSATKVDPNAKNNANNKNVNAKDALGKSVHSKDGLGKNVHQKDAAGRSVNPKDAAKVNAKEVDRGPAKSSVLKVSDDKATDTTAASVEATVGADALNKTEGTQSELTPADQEALANVAVPVVAVPVVAVDPALLLAAAVTPALTPTPEAMAIETSNVATAAPVQELPPIDGATPLPTAALPTTPNSGNAVDVAVTDPTIDAKPVNALPLPTQNPVGVEAGSTPVIDAAELLDSLQASVANTAATGVVASDGDSDKASKVLGAISDLSTNNTAFSSIASQQQQQQPLHRIENNTSVTTPRTEIPVSQQPPLEPYKQIANIVAPLRQMNDGAYHMTLRLNPAHLGSVEVAVTLASGQISMQMSADNSSSRQMLRDSMNDLRQSLQSAGVETGALDVGSGDLAQQQTQQGSDSRGVATQWSSADENDFFTRLAATAPTLTGDDGGPLDVRV